MAQRVAIVTGGMGGLGEAICIKLSGMGYRVIATYSPGNTKSADWLAQMKKQGSLVILNLLSSASLPIV